MADERVPSQRPITIPIPADFADAFGNLGRLVEEQVARDFKRMQDFRNLPEAEKEALRAKAELERQEKERQEDVARSAMLAVLAKHPDVIEALQRWHELRDMWCEDCCLNDMLASF